MWAVEHLETKSVCVILQTHELMSAYSIYLGSGRFPGLILSTLSLLLRLNEAGTLSPIECEQLALSNLPRLLLVLVEDHPNQ